MFAKLRDLLINIIKSRLFVLGVLFTVAAIVIISRLFYLQIVKGEEYLDNYQLKILRERSVNSTRGNIFDRNGYLLAYNELAYNITIEDVFEDNKYKNRIMNDTIYRLIQLIEKNGDSVVNEYKIYVDEDGNYAYSVEGKQLLRFLADIYGKASTNDLTYEEKTSTPEDIVQRLCAKKYYGIGSYDEENNLTPMEGYEKKDILKIIAIRTALSSNKYQKFVSTIVANDVSDETVAIVKEYSDELPGVKVSSATVRRYNDSTYFSQIIGYTGKISNEEYEEYSKLNDNYSLNDYVGKTGIEYSCEDKLQGIKGKETIYVDVMGRILDTTDYVEPIAGNDIYLTIDKNLQIAIYSILEQKIAGILVAKIRNVKNYTPPENASSSDLIIPIDDVYFALFDNNVINTSRFSQSYASVTEKQIYESFLAKEERVLSELEKQLTTNDKAYNELSKEYQIYESYIISMLMSDNHNVLVRSEINTEDETYIKWTTEESISLKEYLNYCISQNWIDTSKLAFDMKYSSSEEIYNGLVDYILSHLTNNTDFAKKLYKYMIYNNDITGKQVCIVLWDQDLINVEESRIKALKAGSLSSYDFMIHCISTLQITPAQLSLDPCSASCVVTDVNTGDVLALVSYPSYDNNKLANSADAAYLAKLNADQSKPLWNYATQYRCAPGSTFKMVSSVAAIEEGVINLGTEIQCTGSFTKLNDTVHKCWIYPSAHGNLTLSEAIANSCNNFFYEVGYRLSQGEDGYDPQLGIDRLAKYVQLFGLDEKSGVEISESDPQVSDRLPVPSAIGQGTNAFTTVGLSRYVTAVANSGTVYDLTLIDKIVSPTGVMIEDNHANVRNRIDLSASVWNAIHSGMRMVVQKKKYFDIGVEVAGKTGTAQEVAGKANHALFVCYAPYNKPEISVATRIMNGYSSDYAAQATKDILLYYYSLEAEDKLITGEADTPITSGNAGD